MKLHNQWATAQRWVLTGMAVAVLTACATPQSSSMNNQPVPAAPPSPQKAPSGKYLHKVNDASFARLFEQSYAYEGSQAQSSGVDNSRYSAEKDNSTKTVIDSPVSTFSLDVDTGSYANVRQYLNNGRVPPAGAVRIEELLNYFPKETAVDSSGQRLGNAPFKVDYEITQTPWSAEKALLRLDVQAVDVAQNQVPAANLVFLVDVSGSMSSPDRLPLAKKSLKALTERLRPQDKITLVTYAGSTAVVLKPTWGDRKDEIVRAIDQLGAGGSTAGGAGLQLAYESARKAFIKGGINRILLMTDGDFNVGVSDTQSLKKMVENNRDSGVTLSTLGFGTGNLNDAMMEQIADAGNGNYSYIDSEKEVEKVLGDELRSTFLTVAKDVKAQVEFNPAQVKSYRQIGYENRQLAREDFNNDKVDAGDIGAGKRITVLYELILAGHGKSGNAVDPLRYRVEPTSTDLTAHGNELAFLKMRWKTPTGSQSELVSLPLLSSLAIGQAKPFEQGSVDMRFMGAVAAFGQKLRANPAVEKTSWDQILNWANDAKGSDDKGYRREFVGMVRSAKNLPVTNQP